MLRTWHFWELYGNAFYFIENLVIPCLRSEISYFMHNCHLPEHPKCHYYVVDYVNVHLLHWKSTWHWWGQCNKIQILRRFNWPKLLGLTTWLRAILERPYRKFRSQTLLFGWLRDYGPIWNDYIEISGSGDETLYCDYVTTAIFRAPISKI